MIIMEEAVTQQLDKGDELRGASIQHIDALSNADESPGSHRRESPYSDNKIGEKIVPDNTHLREPLLPIGNKQGSAGSLKFYTENEAELQKAPSLAPIGSYNKFRRGNESKLRNEINQHNKKEETPLQEVIKQELPAPVNPEDSKKIEPNYYFEELGIEEEKFGEFFEQYKKEVPNSIIATFLPPHELQEKMEAGAEPYFLAFKQKGQNNDILGLAAFNIDPTSQIRKRVNLHHISTKNKDIIGDIIHEFLKFAWENVCCDEIRVGLYHQANAEGHMFLEDWIKEKFTQEKFRWKTLTNDKSGTRVMVLGLNRPQEVTFLNPRNIDTSKEPVTFKYGLVMGFGEKEHASKDPKHANTLWNYACVLQCLTEFKDKKLGNTKLSQMIEKAELISLIERAEGLDTLKLPASRANCGENFELVMKDIKSQNVDLDYNKLSLYPTLSSSVMSLVYKWKSCELATHKISGKNMNYLRLKDEKLTFAKSSRSNDELIIIPTDDASISSFIIVPESFENFDSNGNLFAAVSDILKNSKIEESTFTDVWIPGFKIEVKNNYMKWLEDIAPKSQYHTEAYESSFLELYAPKPNKGMLKIKPQHNSFVINKPFIFGLLHETIDETLEIPLMMTKVYQDNWTEA